MRSLAASAHGGALLGGYDGGGEDVVICVKSASFNKCYYRVSFFTVPPLKVVSVDRQIQASHNLDYPFKLSDFQFELK